MIAFLIILCAFLAIVLGLSVVYLVRYASMILDVQDALEDALDVMDGTYSGICDLLELPIMVDTPEVRQVVDKLKEARNAVLYVSNVLVAPYGGIVEDDNSIDSDKAALGSGVESRRDRMG